VPTTCSPARAGSVARLSAVVFLLATAGIALAAPAAAMEDPRRPSATVTHGPSCGPGVVRTLVTNGTEQHTVTLVFDGGSVQDSATLGPGEQVELVSSDVDWGTTVDVSVTVTAGDGTPEEPLELDTYTRPSTEDCAAVTPPTSDPAPPPSSSAPPATPDVPATPPGTEPETTPPTTVAPVPSTPGVPTTTGPTTTGPSTTAPRPTGPATSAPGTVATSATPEAGGPPRTSGAGTPAATAGRGSAASSSAAAVSPGGVVTLRATGFTAGEPVTVTIPGIDEPLTTVTAAADGSVETVVQIPRDAALGSTTVQFTGTDSATTAGLDLDVAARDRVVPESTGSPAAVAAGVALVAAAGTLGVMGARRSRGRHADADR
jgi:hypothetical protein